MTIYAISSVAKFEFDFVVVVIIFGGSAARSTTTTMAKFHKKNYCWADFRFRRLDRSRFIFIISILALFTLLNACFFWSPKVSFGGLTQNEAMLSQSAQEETTAPLCLLQPNKYRHQGRGGCWCLPEPDWFHESNFEHVFTDNLRVSFWTAFNFL